MEYVSSSDGGEAVGMVITWMNLPSLMPGETKVLALDARLVDVTQPSYVNRAAVTKDGSSLYSSGTVEVRDVDSTPSKIDPGLPLPEIDTASFVALPVRQVQADNNALPSTGSDIGSTLTTAAAGLATGVMLLLIGRRRRVQT
jgi:LPXTG-motif cell wall-anchored protein